MIASSAQSPQGATGLPGGEQKPAEALAVKDISLDQAHMAVMAAATKATEINT